MSLRVLRTDRMYAGLLKAQATLSRWTDENPVDSGELVRPRYKTVTCTVITMYITASRNVTPGLLK